MNEGVANEQCRQQGKEDDEDIDHQDASRLVEIVFAVKTQVEGEANHENGRVENMSEERQLVLLDAVVTQLVLMLTV